MMRLGAFLLLLALILISVYLKKRPYILALSPDYTRYAVSYPIGRLVNNDVDIFSLETGMFLKTLKGHSDRGIFAAAFSPDGKKIATGSLGDKTVRIWDTETGKMLKILHHPSPILRVTFSPDG
ncbi:PD40 domain-containing protein, partial [Candidatus Dependentiae bacterium]|nr:PD40 domain-containing protein [Candidatus Dependentiae bacterium]